MTGKTERPSFEAEARALADRMLLLWAQLAKIDSNCQSEIAGGEGDANSIARRASAAAIQATYKTMRGIGFESVALVRAYLALEAIDQGKTVAMLSPDRQRRRPKTTERGEILKAKVAAIAFARGQIDRHKERNAKTLSKLLRGSRLAYATTGRPTVATRTILDWTKHYAKCKPSERRAAAAFKHYVRKVQSTQDKNRGGLTESDIKAMLDRIAQPLPA